MHEDVRATPSRANNVALGSLAGMGLPLAMLGLPLVVIIPEYYGNALGLELALVGAIFTLVRVLDIIIDPLLGAWMDRTRTRIGRFKPWLLAGAPLLMAGTGLLFFGWPGVGGVYLTIALSLTYLAWSIVQLAQLSLGAGLADSYGERARVFAWLQGVFLCGTVLVMAMPLLLGEEQANDAAAGVSAMGWLIIAVTVPTLLVALKFVPDINPPPRHDRISFGTYLSLLRRPSVGRLVIADVVFGMGFGVASSTLLFYFTNMKGIDRSAVGLLLIAQMGTAMFAAPLVAHTAQRLGKQRALILFGILSALSPPLLTLVPVGGLSWALAGMALWGVAYCGVTTLPRAMMADAGDEVRLATSHDATGLLFSLLISSWKLGGALSVGVAFLALQLIGFDAQLGSDNPASALQGLEFMYAGLPVFLCMLGVFSLVRYPLTSTVHAKIVAQLKNA